MRPASRTETAITAAQDLIYQGHVTCEDAEWVALQITASAPTDVEVVWTAPDSAESSVLFTVQSGARLVLWASSVTVRAQTRKVPGETSEVTVVAAPAPGPQRNHLVVDLGLQTTATTISLAIPRWAERLHVQWPGLPGSDAGAVKLLLGTTPVATFNAARPTPSEGAPVGEATSVEIEEATDGVRLLFDLAL